MEKESKFLDEMINFTISSTSLQIKKHYYYESFIDPDKKFVTLLEKLIVK